MKSIALAATLLTALAAQAAPLKVATWNLGWHLDAEEAKTWIAECGKPFALQGEIWKPVAAPGEGTKPGWQLPWGRNAPVEWDIGKLPPCDIYQAQRQGEPQRTVVPVTEAQWAQRVARAGTLIRDRLQPDVIAFQEVSGEKAIRELLGKNWEVCSYEGHKVQRLAIAWKASLGAGKCEVNWPMALPERALREQVRPGLSLTLQVDGKPFTVMTVHLKSSCVSPLDDQSRTPGRGQLDGEEPNCKHLQQQVKPLEAWIEAQAAKSEAFVLLGDFNRNLGHEASEAADAAVRNGERTRNLWRELNDGSPKLQLLSPQCEGELGSVCSLAKQRLLDGREYGRLRGELGCRNPIGLDHVVIGSALSSPGGAHKQSLGRAGETRWTPEGAELGLSDHCPVMATVQPASP
jgi:endonuclease/exonuclease/phosphatase family metal-dependent hydrolase